MKPGVLSRRTPLRNRKAMRRTSGQTTRTTTLARNGIKRTRTTSKPRPNWTALREALAVRAGGVCERCGCCPGTDAHHRVLRSRGGGHTLDNLVWLCGSGTTGCHGHVHAHPAEATADGFIVASWESPDCVPIRLADGRLVALTDTGTYVVLPEHPDDRDDVRGIHATEES